MKNTVQKNNAFSFFLCYSFPLKETPGSGPKYQKLPAFAPKYHKLPAFALQSIKSFQLLPCELNHLTVFRVCPGNPADFRFQKDPCTSLISGQAAKEQRYV